VRLDKNIGKTGAMMAGVEQSTARNIAFFDADAVNMKPDYATALAGEYRKGGYAQVCGVLDHGIMNTSRLATGQHIVRRDVLEGIPKTCNGYSAETAINYIADKFGPTQTVLLAGLQFRAKSEKVGVVAGMAHQ
jgi:glycosyltransferase involved in cell wall biosynthesis